MSFDLSKPWWQGWVYRRIGTREPVEWMSHKSSHIYHATTDGKHCVCGAPGDLEHRIPWFTVDPSSDPMACVRCQDLVTRQRKGGNHEEEDPNRSGG